MKVRGAMFKYLRDQSRKGRDAEARDLAALHEIPPGNRHLEIDLSALTYHDADTIMTMVHGDEIRRAVKEDLSPKQREYVYLRFWLGWQQPELKAHFGYDPGGLWRNPGQGAKKKLRQSLDHLRGE